MGQPSVHERVFIGCGSNVGDRSGRIRNAMLLLGSLPGTRVVKTSSFYETEPVGFRNQPEFVNAVAELSTACPPEELFQHLKQLERRLGRVERPRWHEREIDLDILYYGSLVLNSDVLTIPHPERAGRRFVLAPLAEIAPDFVDPAVHATSAEMLRRCVDQSLIRRLNDQQLDHDENISAAS